MMSTRLRHLLSNRSIMIGGLIILSVALALLLGRWLAVVQAPLTRHVVARNLLENGAPDQAAHIFETPIWQGVALYRAGRYHRSVGAFVTDDSVTGLYNMGNAYTRLGLYRGAIAAYETVLRRQPTHEDAHYNLELVRAAAKRAQELENESRETENAGQWEDGLVENEQEGQSEPEEGEPSTEGNESDPSELPEGQEGEQDATADAAETQMSEPQSAGEGIGGSDREGEQAEATTFSLTGSEDEDADDLSDDGSAPENAEVLGGMVDHAREEAMADEILLRRIQDDPAVVLKARLNMALRRQRANR